MVCVCALWWVDAPSWVVLCFAPIPSGIGSGPLTTLNSTSGYREWVDGWKLSTCWYVWLNPCTCIGENEVISIKEINWTFFKIYARYMRFKCLFEQILLTGIFFVISDVVSVIMHSSLCFPLTSERFPCYITCIVRQRRPDSGRYRSPVCLGWRDQPWMINTILKTCYRDGGWVLSWECPFD